MEVAPPMPRSARACFRSWSPLAYSLSGSPCSGRRSSAISRTSAASSSTGGRWCWSRRAAAADVPGRAPGLDRRDHAFVRPGGALAFRERRIVAITSPIGLVLTGLTFWVFNYGLGLSCPSAHSSKICCRPPTKTPNREALTMETLAALGHGFGVALTPMQPVLVGAGRHRRHRHRRAARNRPGVDRGAAAAGHAQLDPDRRLHHVRRHLLRGHVWRLDHVDPAEHAGRVQLDRHCRSTAT